MGALVVPQTIITGTALCRKIFDAAEPTRSRWPKPPVAVRMLRPYTPANHAGEPLRHTEFSPKEQGFAGNTKTSSQAEPI
jgi:hypothetical protein